MAAGLVVRLVVEDAKGRQNTLLLTLEQAGNVSAALTEMLAEFAARWAKGDEAGVKAAVIEVEV